MLRWLVRLCFVTLLQFTCILVVQPKSRSKRRTLCGDTVLWYNTHDTMYAGSKPSQTTTTTKWISSSAHAKMSLIYCIEWRFFMALEFDPWCFTAYYTQYYVSMIDISIAVVMHFFRGIFVVAFSVARFSFQWIFCFVLFVVVAFSITRSSMSISKTAIIYYVIL